MRRLTVAIAVLCCIGALGLAGCGSSSSSSTASGAGTSGSASTVSAGSGTKSLATAKFVLHAGLALGAFHRWIYKPIKAGALKNPGSHKLALVKGGVAALFVYHELKLSADNAKSSKLLAPLVAPITAAGNKLSSLKTSITNGSVSASDIDAINSQLDEVKSKAAASGQSIKESIPSASQLVTGS